MGRRRRKTTPRRPIRTIPTIFTCPICGRNAVRIEMNYASGEANVHCGNCDTKSTVTITSISEPVDAYGEFVDYCASKTSVKS